MSDDRQGWLSEQALAAWARLAAAPGVPQLVDVPILVRPNDDEMRRGRVALRATTERGEDLGPCYVFNNEWYPGCPSTMPFSHYAPTLERVLTAMVRRGETDPLRLQVLKAVLVRTTGERTLLALLKFVIAPEYTLTGTEVEAVYGCPLAVFYTRFVGISWDPRRRRNASGSVRGDAIHRGYQRAATAYVATGDRDQARAAYFDGVRATWIQRLPNLFLDRPVKPGADHLRPVQAVEAVLDYCRDSWPPPARARIFQERLFYSPTRGISGRADRIEQRDGDRGPSRLVEVKSGGSFGAENDPVTGERRPGGLQSLSYREILRSFGLEQVETVVEQVGDTTIEPVPLERHPIVTRLGLALTPGEERAIDLIAQSRNIGYCVASGLYSGYDRHLLDGAAGTHRFLAGVGGDFDLYHRLPPCRICAAHARGVCDHGTRGRDRPVYNLFRYAPGRLFAYWAWFHRQLKAEERAGRQWLYHLVATPPADLEGQEGITVGGLGASALEGYEVVFSRERRIETRLREEDRVLVTPLERHPGQVLSIEGTVVAIGEREIRVRLNDPLDDPATTYRLDQLGAFEMRPWQLEGLTDFLLAAMAGAAARGRQIRVEELPRLARTLLGAERPAAPRVAPVTGVADLNAHQREALGAALALEPGDLLLVQGPPGTGKTSLIAHIARDVLARHFWDWDTGDTRRPVLILANTHRAANEVVRKIVERFPDLRPFLVRVGTKRADMEPEVAAQVLAEKAGAEVALRETDMATDGPATLVRAIRRANRYHDHAGIFVGTLGSADAPELRGLTFEMVIVDETGQATEPAMLQALRHLPAGLDGRLLLIGDHQQLPPVVASDLSAPEVPESHEALGLQPGDSLRTSAFERLARLYPERVLTLTDQYRMNATICDLVSGAFYDGRLEPGTSRVAERSLGAWFDSHGLARPAGIFARGASLIFIDTSADPAARDSGARFSGRGVTDEARDNTREAEIVARVIADLVSSVPKDRLPRVLTEIGVISPYRKQNNRIAQELVRVDAALAAPRVDTVDRFQGGEREVIVVSLVNSNPGAAIGPLHADPRRMNVAISRARRTLVIVGDRETFCRDAGRPEEDEAKTRYRHLFGLIDELAGDGRALVIDSRRQGSGTS